MPDFGHTHPFFTLMQDETRDLARGFQHRVAKIYNLDTYTTKYVNKSSELMVKNIFLKIGEFI